MVHFRQSLLLAVALFGVATAVPAVEPDPVFTATELREDLGVLHKALVRAHPGVHRYTSPEELNQAFAKTSAALKSPLTEAAFLRRIMPYLALVRDDHTYLMPSTAFMEQRFGATGYGQSRKSGDLPLFPFFVTVEKNRLFITHNNSSDDSFSRGTEILRIDGRSAATVIATLERAMPTSGFSSTYAKRHLEQYSPQQEFSFFDLYYALLIGTPETFALQVRVSPDEKPKNVTVSAVRAAALWENFRRRYVGKTYALLARDAPLRLEYPRADTAVLSLSSFHTWRWNRAKLAFRKDLAATFSALAERKVANLIVDLRGNEGGDAGIGIEVLSYLATRPFQVYAYKEMTANRFPDLAAYVQNPKDLDHFTDNLFEPAKDGRIRIKTSLPDETWSRPMAASQPAFAGRLWVLADGATGSAAAQLATLIRVNRADAVFIGEESGGDMEGPVSGSFISIKLPHTGVRIDVPVLYKAMYLNGYRNQRGRGVVPDYAVAPDQNDLIAGRDPAMLLALQQAAR